MSNDGNTLLIFDFGTQKWTDLVQMSLGYPQWSHNGDAVFFLGHPPGADKVFRVRLSDKKLEEVVDLKNFHPAPSSVGTWIGWLRTTPSWRCATPEPRTFTRSACSFRETAGVQNHVDPGFVGRAARSWDRHPENTRFDQNNRPRGSRRTVSQYFFFEKHAFLVVVRGFPGCLLIFGVSQRTIDDGRDSCRRDVASMNKACSAKSLGLAGSLLIGCLCIAPTPARADIVFDLNAVVGNRAILPGPDYNAPAGAGGCHRNLGYQYDNRRAERQCQHNRSDRWEHIYSRSWLSSRFLHKSTAPERPSASCQRN